MIHHSYKDNNDTNASAPLSRWRVACSASISAGSLLWSPQNVGPDA